MKGIKESFKDVNGKYSSKRAIMFVFSLLFVINFFFELLGWGGITYISLIIIGIVIVVGFKFLTGEQVTTILKRPSNSYYDNDIYNPLGRKANPDEPDPNIEE